jgi:hypothetical protein
MILPDNASGRLVLENVIPSTVFLGQINILIQNNRKFRGIAICGRLNAVAGAGQLRFRLESSIGGEANTMLTTTYYTTLNAQTHIFYPGTSVASGAIHYSGTIPESFRVGMENISAVPGNEVTATLHVVLLE